MAGGEAQPVSPVDAFLALESADGAYLYYVESGQSDGAGLLWRMPLKGGDPIKLVEGVSSLAFAVVDGGVYYPERAASETRLQYFDFSTHRSTTVAGTLGPLPIGLVGSVTASRDGRTILFSRVDSSVDDLMLVENFR